MDPGSPTVASSRPAAGAADGADVRGADERVRAAFPELAAEQRHLDTARRNRDRMIAELEAVDPASAADEITGEYVEMAVWEALDSLRSPGAGEFFGRIDTDDAGYGDAGHGDAGHGDGGHRDDRGGPGRGEGRGGRGGAGGAGHGAGRTSGRWYIGRRHIADEHNDALVVDWRAPIAAGFYRATAADRLDVTHRRRFSLDDGRLSAYLDEQLDDPDAVDVAAGIPDPVLAEIGAERTGTMREIVATIQAEQDVVIRAPADALLIVQGGPGTGKTAVALHRAAYLMFEHRQRLAREGVAVIGPNRAFLDYIGHVLPSLGERSVRQCTVVDLCVPKVEVTATDSAEIAVRKGSVEALRRLEELALSVVTPPGEAASVPFGVRRLRFGIDEIAEWLARATDSVIPINERRIRLKAIAQQELRRRSGGDDAWRHAAELKAILNAAWPVQQPKKLAQRLIDELAGPPRGKRRWSVADQLLVDEANSLLNGAAQRFGHVLVDEAQDHSAVALRVLGRRSTDGLTLVGDLAQSTAPAGQQRWADVVALLGESRQAEVAELTIGYRVPAPILAAANELLPATGVDVSPSRSVRVVGAPPAQITVDSSHTLAAAAADTVVAVKHRHRLTGVVAPAARHAELTIALAAVGFAAVDHVHDLGAGDVPLFDAERVKGLEFDGVVIVAPDEIDDGSHRGARLLYVAMTRAVQELRIVDVGPNVGTDAR